jgi:phosphohistidine phosphatase
MKTLLIMRHAKSDYPPHIANDFERPLNKRGNKDVPRMAGVLQGTALIPDQVLSSPARRARQTAEGMAAGMGLAPTILFDERLYLAAPQTLAEVTAELPDGCETALVVAHNPGLEEWILRLCGGQLRLPTAGLVALHLNVPRWARIQAARGQLQWFVIPRLIRAVA